VASDPISEFYTRHPYPPPVANLDRARDQWRDASRDRAEYHLLWPGEPYRATLDILVAGCGTWQAAKYALCRPHAHVVGIDVSATSIDHTERLKRQYDLSNLELRQLPIESAAFLDRAFDLIVCTGVLHHLADPDEGMRALRAVLRPGGAMYMMVYAPYGRAGVYLLQDYCRRLGIGSSRAEIDDLVTTLEALPPHHPLSPLLRSSRDGSHADALADALLNPRDQAYSVPQLFDFVERTGWTLGRWYWQAPYLPQCGAVAATPHARRLAALPEREQYAAMELFRGTMACHSAVLYHGDLQVEKRQVRFDRDDWRRYVPIRLPWTQLIVERLPAGAAGVLLNRSHPFSDLVLPLDARDKRLFAAIDGHRSVDEIAEHAEEADVDRVRLLVERLWRYDQVTFDASGEGDIQASSR
jgi:SAM-dependent methyltransferase